MSKTKKKVSKRSKAKCPALDKQMNTKGRRYYIETDYINGVVNEDGETVIRKMTDDEKEWLNQFYRENLNATFKKDEENFFDTVEEKRMIYSENNARNRCIYNFMLKTGRLRSMNDQNLDALDIDWERLELTYSSSIMNLDPELILQYMLDEDSKYSDDGGTEDN